MEKAKIVIQPLVERARRNKRRIVFPDGENDKVLRAIERLIEGAFVINPHRKSRTH